MAFGRQVGKARAENLNSSANLKKIVGKNIATRSSSRINSFEEDVPSPFDAVLAAASHASFDDDDDDNVSQTVGNKENESKFFGNYLDKKPLGNGKKQRRSGDSSPAPTAVGTGEKNYSSTGSKVTKITTIDDEQKSKVINSYSFYKDNIYPYTNEMLEGIRESKPSATTNTSECMLMNDKVYKILGSEFNLNSTEALISKKSFLESEELKTSLISNECQNKEKSSGLSDNNIKKNSTKKSWNNETEDLADALLNGINALEGTLTLKSTIKSNKRSRETQKSNFPLSNNVSSAIGYEPSNQMTSTAIDRVPKLPIISTLLQSSQIIAKGPITTDVSSFSQDSLVRAYNQVNNSIPKIDKGLRHFSALVCAKVEEKGSTTYNEVADELVIELSKDSSLSEGGKLCDHKNIRRRVYDALNVLMAIDIIKKDKKDICWLGIPDEKAREKRQLEQEIINVRIRVEEKRKMLVCHIQRLAALKSLIRRNESTAHRTISSSKFLMHYYLSTTITFYR